MSTTGPEPLEQFLGAMQGAGLDLHIEGILDALWLALQPGLRLETEAPGTAKPETELFGAGEPVEDDTGTVTSGVVGTVSPVSDIRQTAFEDRSPPAELGLFSAIAGEGEKETLPASPLRVPGGAALAQKLQLARSLRPLRRWFANSQLLELDEEATADATAESGGMTMPVFQPLLERWYELIVVADSTPSMDVWVETTLEFEAVARTAGVFRDIRRYRLVWKSASAAALAGKERETDAVLLNSDGVPSPATTLAQTNVRRLIFVATNGSAAHWNDGRMEALLGVWRQLCSVVILHMLPQDFWDQVRTGEPSVLLRTLSPGAATSLLEATPLWWDTDAAQSEDERLKRILGTVPILPLNPAWIDKWARMQMGGGQRVPGIVVGERADQKPRRDPATPQDWKRMVDAFTRHASPEARSLAVYLARAPFTLPVARLVQTVKLGNEASQTQLAEILLSRLVQRTTPADSTVPREWVEYRFHPEAARILLRGLRDSDAREIAGALARHIERHWGRPVNLTALVYDPQGLSAIPKWAQPFAYMGRSLLNLPPGTRSPRDLVERFRQSQPVDLVGRASRLAISVAQGPLLIPDSELRNAMADSELLEQVAGKWQFRPGIQPALATIHAATPLLGIQILWVDDHPENNRLESGELTLMGARIHTVLDTASGLSEVGRTRFDVIISDMKRQGDRRAGFTLLDGLRSRGVITPVIIYAARFTQTGAEEARRAGAFGCTTHWKDLHEYALAAATFQGPRPVRPQVAAILGRLYFDPDVVAMLLKDWQQRPKRIASELLARASTPSIAYRNCLQIIQAYAASGVNQLFMIEDGALRLAADVVDEGKARYSEASWDGIIGRAAKSGRVVWVPEVSRDPGYIEAEPTTASELVLPLALPAPTARILGVINMEMTLKNALHSDEIDWLASFTAELGNWMAERPPDISAVQSEAGSTVAEVTYVTDRAEDTSSDIGYSASRSDRIEFGVCHVTIPGSHRIGNLELPNVLKLQFRPDPRKHFTLLDIKRRREEPLDRFYRELKPRDNGFLVYIHGYNVDFIQSVFRCAQMYFDLGLDLVPILYAWPSAGAMTGYARDEAAAEWSTVHFSQIITQLRNQFGSGRLHVLAEGMGCRILLSALVRTRSLFTSHDPALLQAIFVRPDVDAAVFASTLREIRGMTSRVTVYVEPRDASLQAAKRLNGFERAGSKVQIIPGVDVIDMSDAATDLLNVGRSVKLLADLHDLLRGLPPIKRFGLRPVGEASYWELMP